MSSAGTPTNRKNVKTFCTSLKRKAHEGGEKSSQPERLTGNSCFWNQKMRDVHSYKTGLEEACDEGKYHRSAFQVLKSSGGVGGRLIHRSRELFLYTEEVRRSPMRVSTSIPDGQKTVVEPSIRGVSTRSSLKSKALLSARSGREYVDIECPPEEEEEGSSNIHPRCSRLYTHRRSLPFKVHTHTPPLYLAQYPPPHLPSPKPPTTLTTSPNTIYLTAPLSPPKVQKTHTPPTEAPKILPHPQPRHRKHTHTPNQGEGATHTHTQRDRDRDRDRQRQRDLQLKALLKFPKLGVWGGG